MSLQSDLARNRRVFERLTASGASGENAKPRKIYEAPYIDEADAVTREIFTVQEPQKPAESYSLEYGTRRRTGMALDFKPPGGVEYPSPRGDGAAAASDPLESLYYQLEVGARLSSQLSQEEEF